MKVMVAGATGVIGRQLVPRLIDAGHTVAGTTRTPGKVGLLERAGARAFVVDALDPNATTETVASFEPDAIVVELTDLAHMDARHFERDFAATDRLRTEGVDHLLEAGRLVGVRRFLAQSFAGWPYARTGSAIKTERDPLDPAPVAPMRRTLEAIRHMEGAVTGATWADGLALRYGFLYGPGTSLAADGGEIVELIRRRAFPIVGDGEGMWSFVHVEDAAEATALALERGRPGVYNIVDDEPAPIGDWLPTVAAQLGAKPPRQVPRWLGRLLAGEAVATLSTEARGASNALAKQELGWTPRHASWRHHMAEGAT